jgi:hypothetical protein
VRASTCTYLIPVSLFNMSHINVGIWFRLFRPLSLSRAPSLPFGGVTQERGSDALTIQQHELSLESSWGIGRLKRRIGKHNP